MRVAAAGLPAENSARRSVDCWEDNRVLGPEGQLQLHQVILWRWEWHAGAGWGFFVVAWFRVEETLGPFRAGNAWCGVVRGQGVTAATVRQSVTGFDPELLDRDRLPVAERTWGGN